MGYGSSQFFGIHNGFCLRDTYCIRYYSGHSGEREEK